MNTFRFILSAAAVASAVSACAPKVQPTSNNPHAFITDPDKAAMLTTLEELDPERLYVMNYTADYKTDELIDYGVEGVDQMIGFLSAKMFDVPAENLTIPLLSTGCSAYAATEDSSNDYLMGRNYDYCHVEKGVEVPATAIFVRTAPEGGKKSISMVDAYWLGFHKGFYNDGRTDLSMLMAMPYMVLDGMNEDGFAICVLHLDGKATRQDEPGKKTIWTSVMMRKLLDSASTVEEALALAKTYNMSMMSTAKGNMHFYLADATGDYAILEYSYADAASVDDTLPNEMKVFRGKECDRYVTNFYVDPALAEHPNLGPLGKHGLWRYDTLRVNLAKCKDRLSEDQAMGLLKAVSQDPKPEETTSHTQWSAVYNLSQKKLDLCLLQEYGNKYSFTIE